MIYNNFAYDKHEWDNIPAIVPRYTLYLSKYIKGLSEVCNEMYSRENVKDLRNDLENKM